MFKGEKGFYLFINEGCDVNIRFKVVGFEINYFCDKLFVRLLVDMLWIDLLIIVFWGYCRLGKLMFIL